MEHIHQKINAQRDTFSKGFKKVATYLYNDPKIFAMYSATEVGKKIGVSETTIIRFSHKLGYKGFSALQEDVQHNLFQKSSLTDYRETKITNNNTYSIKQLMCNDMENISKLIEQIDEIDLESAVSKLISADRILVSGVRSSHSLASWFSFALDLVVGNTRFYQPNVDDILLRISELTKESVFVAFSFHRYATDTIHIAKLVKKQGGYVIAITDSLFAPITEYSDLTIPVQLNVKSTLDAAPVVMSLLNSIISTISLQNKELFQKRVERFESIEVNDFFRTI